MEYHRLLIHIFNPLRRNCHTFRMLRSMVRILAMAAMLTLFLGCGGNKPYVESPETSIAPAKVHTAMAGGGWRAHTPMPVTTKLLALETDQLLKEVA
jgi:hypothetical protein